MTEKSEEFFKSRPWMNQPKYHDEMPVILVKMMYDGAHVTEVCRELGISRATFYEYCKTNPEFKAAAELGATFSEGWHQHKGRTNLGNDKFNAVLWQMIGRNRFGMAEHRAVKLPDFDTAESYTDKMRILNKALADGQITPVEFNQLSNGVGVQARIEEITELKKIVEELQSKVNQHRR